MNRVKLPEICTIPITDGTHQTPTYTTKEDGIPFISSKDVTTKKIDWTNIKYITKDLHEQLYKRIAPQKNDILLAKNGTTGVAALVEDNRVFDIYVTLAVIRPDLEKVFPKYLLHVINSDYCKKQFSSHLVGIGVPNLHLKDINQTSIPLPSLPEQQKIATHLDSIQNAIDNKKQQLQQLDELVKSKYHNMFDNLVCDIKTIANTCTMKSGTTFSKEEELSSGEVFYIKVSGMNLEGNEKYITTANSFVTKITAGQTTIPANSIIFPKRGGAIGTNKKRITKKEICIDLNTMAVTPGQELDIQYLYQYFQELDMGKLYNGAAVPQINNKDIGPLELKVPPIELQNTFAEYVQKIDSAKSIIKIQLVDLQELLDSKMDEYFGEL